MDEIKSTDDLEKIKAACAAAGYEFVGRDGDKILVKSIEPPAPEPISIKEAYDAVVLDFEFNGRHSDKTSGRKRYGKRPKFHE